MKRLETTMTDQSTIHHDAFKRQGPIGTMTERVFAPRGA